MGRWVDNRVGKQSSMGEEKKISECKNELERSQEAVWTRESEGGGALWGAEAGDDHQGAHQPVRSTNFLMGQGALKALIEK